MSDSEKVSKTTSSRNSKVNLRLNSANLPNPGIANPKSNEDYWDRYAHLRKDMKNEKGQWPGDEWGRQDRWERLFQSMFKSQLPAELETAIEIGPGSGKYTLMMVRDFPNVKVIASDISASYLSVLRERCSKEIQHGRIIPEKIEHNIRTIYDIAARHGITPGTLDVMYSIDAMVHVDLQYLIVYWLTARELLKPGGKMIMTVADATRPMGFYRLVENAEKSFKAQDRNIGKFEWISGGITRSVLNKLGFKVVEIDTPSSPRDFCFVATKMSLPAFPTLEEVRKNIRSGDYGSDEFEEEG